MPETPANPRRWLTSTVSSGANGRYRHQLLKEDRRSWPDLQPAFRSYVVRAHQDAIREFRPYFDEAPVYGHGPSLEDFMAQTPLTVGSVEQAVERTLGFREYAGDYARQLFLVDHAGLPLDAVLRQLDLLGEVVAELRKHEPARVVEATETLEGSPA